MIAVQQAATEGTITGPVEWIESTSHRVAALAHEVPGSRDIPVYVVSMQGHFVLDSAPRPSLATHSPEGTSLVVFIPIPNNDDGGGGVVLTNGKVDLTPYGEVQTLQLG